MIRRCGTGVFCIDALYYPHHALTTESMVSFRVWRILGMSFSFHLPIHIGEGRDIFSHDYA